MNRITNLQATADSVSARHGGPRGIDVRPLVEREQAIAANLIERATALGLSERDARQVVSEAGLSVAPLPRPVAPRQAPAARSGSPRDLLQQAAQLISSAADAL